MPAKVAYLFLVYGDVYHAGVWEKYFVGHEDTVRICCHAADRTKTTTPFLRDNLIPYWVSTKWAGLGLVLAHLELIRYALRDPDVQRLVLCSDSCVPIKSCARVHELLFGDDRTWLHTTTQYTERMSKVTTIPKQHRRKNSQWVALTRRHAMLLTRFNFVSDFAHCKVPDEHYVGSVLVHLGEAEHLRPTHQTHADWCRLSQVQFTPTEYHQVSPELVQRFRSSKSLFARKFPPDSNIADKWTEIMGV
jgi:hypothetical protein